MKITFISWIRYQQRSERLAKHLGAKMHYLYYGQQGKLLQAPVRYLIQALQTWHVMRRDCPDIVFVQNPPIFCVMVVFIYCQLFDARYVIDSHTGAFVSWKWRWSLGLHRMLSRRALTTIVHNKSQEKIVKCWGCRYCVLGFTPSENRAREQLSLDGKFNVAVICSFGKDEPLDVVFEAARRLLDTRFYLTGDSSRIASRLLAKKPHNCCLTDYLPYERYLSLLRGVDVIIVLTTRDHTLLAGAFEAVSLGIPLIVSNWPILQDYFFIGTVHVPNTVEGICEGVRRANHEQATLQRDILRLREQLLAEWEQKFTELQHLLSEPQLKCSRIHRSI